MPIWNPVSKYHPWTRLRGRYWSQRQTTSLCSFLVRTQRLSPRLSHRENKCKEKHGLSLCLIEAGGEGTKGLDRKVTVHRMCIVYRNSQCSGAGIRCFLTLWIRIRDPEYGFRIRDGKNSRPGMNISDLIFGTKYQFSWVKNT
jgi:hypothetical protein